jgi:hypothetical protein
LLAITFTYGVEEYRMLLQYVQLDKNNKEI